MSSSFLALFSVFSAASSVNTGLFDTFPAFLKSSADMTIVSSLPVPATVSSDVTLIVACVSLFMQSRLPLNSLMLCVRFLTFGHIASVPTLIRLADTPFSRSLFSRSSSSLTRSEAGGGVSRVRSL